MKEELQILLDLKEKLSSEVEDLLSRYNVSKISNLSDCCNKQIFIFEEGIIKLKSLNDDHKELSPIYIDFNKRWNYHKTFFKRAKLTNEPLFKAINVKKTNPKIWDTTAGMGKDSILLLFFGADLHAFERSKTISLLFEDAIIRGKQSKDSTLKEVIKNKLKFTNGESMELMQKFDYPDIIYIDPMFPPSKKSALPNKEMQIFKTLFESSEKEALKLLTKALGTQAKRVILKRRLNDPYLLPCVTHSYEGKSIRYDMYTPSRNLA